MKREIKVSKNDNPAKNFGAILKDLEEIAKEKNISVQEAIRQFIVDLQSLDNEEYDKNIKEITINGGLSANLKNSLITYLNKAIKRYTQIEKKDVERKKQNARKQELENTWKKVEEEIYQCNSDKTKVDIIKDYLLKMDKETGSIEMKEEQKKYITKKLNELLKKESKLLEKEENNKAKNLEKKWNEITGIISKEAEKKGKTKIELWDAISEAISGKEKNNTLNIKVPASIKDEIKKLVEEQSKLEGIDYYNDVKNYTNDFEFLTGFRGLSFAMHGHRKFSNTAHEKIFENLIATIRKNENIKFPETEEELLKRVISEDIINTYYGKKIIKERIDKIEKDKKNYELKNKMEEYER